MGGWFVNYSNFVIVLVIITVQHKFGYQWFITMIGNVWCIQYIIIQLYSFCQLNYRTYWLLNYAAGWNH